MEREFDVSDGIMTFTEGLMAGRGISLSCFNSFRVVDVHCFPKAETVNSRRGQTITTCRIL